MPARAVSLSRLDQPRRITEVVAAAPLLAEQSRHRANPRGRAGPPGARICAHAKMVVHAGEAAAVNCEYPAQLVEPTLDPVLPVRRAFAAYDGPPHVARDEMQW